jgi:photosystem II stability/assembly factor-like uncharacterized protein
MSRSWTRIAAVLFALAVPGTLRSQTILDLVPDPGSSSVLWATTESGGVFRSGDSGYSWDARASLPADGTFLAATGSPTLLFASTAAGLYRSEDGAQTWARSDAGLPSPLSSFAVSPFSSAVVYAIAASTVYRSFDAGRTWLPAPGLPSIAGSVATAADPGIAYAALTEPYPSASPREGIYRTADGGATWTRTVFRPSASSIHGASDLFVDPASAGRVFALSTGCGFGCAFTTPVRTDDGGASWRMTDFLPSAADAHGVLYAGGTRSRDHGSTSEMLSTPLGTIGRVFASPASVTIVAQSHGFGIFTFNSTDSGSTWSPINVPRFDCDADPVSLCLNGGRFRARVVFRAAEEQGIGRAVPLTPDAGAFWFFTANNLELVVKVVDGFDGQFWVFVGALTDVEYDIEVFDVIRQTRWTHHNDAGTLASVADTTAF